MPQPEVRFWLYQNRGQGRERGRETRGGRTRGPAVWIRTRRRDADMDRGNQEQLCRGDRRPALEKKPCRPCSGPDRCSQSAVAGLGCEDSGWRILEGTKGGASEATLRSPGPKQTLAPPPPPAAQPRTRASLPAETRRSPGFWRGARLPAPAPLRSSRSAARISPPSGGGDRAAPTRICDSSGGAASGVNIPARTAPWVHRREGSERNREGGRRPAD